jgi:eukaryotic-like serine/threonine-protein kinase
MPLGEQMTFIVNVFPSNATYTWTLDGSPLSNTGRSYVYTAEAGDHTLVVKAKHALGTDAQTWHITCDPISDLLNSLVSIPGGSFQMGSTDDDYGQAQYTTPVHTVTLDGFDIGAYEVTQAQYLAVMGTNPSLFQEVNGYPGHENNPVEKVSWYDARAFCTALSALTGRTITLPSEAQWEYACSAGSTTLYSFGDSDALLDNYAWIAANSGDQTHPIGTKLPNKWDLYDMHGNVYEWCLDSWHNNYTGAPTDGSAWEPETGSGRVLRGGSWNSVPRDCQSALRHGYYPDTWYGIIGFRVVASP